MIKYTYLTILVSFLLLAFNSQCAEHRPASSQNNTMLSKRSGKTKVYTPREQEIYSALRTMPIALIDLVTQYTETILEDVHISSPAKPTAVGNINIRVEYRIPMERGCMELIDDLSENTPKDYPISIEPYDTFASIQAKTAQKGFKIDDKKFFLGQREVKNTQDLRRLLYIGTLLLRPK